MMDNKGSGGSLLLEESPPPVEPMQPYNPNMLPYQHQPPSTPPQNYPIGTVIVMQPLNTQIHQNPVQPMPPTNKWLAVFVTFFCCLPLGLIALKKSNEVEMLYTMGDFMGAIRASDDSKKYSSIGVVLGIIIIIVSAGWLVLRITNPTDNRQ